jgi:hypothetical protein
MAASTTRARPTKELLAAQARAKVAWRREMTRRPFREKVALVLELQRHLYPILSRRRAMRPWERPWKIEG